MTRFTLNLALLSLALCSLAATASAQRPIEGLTSVSVGSEHACGIDPAGAIYCWGNARHGQLGNGVAVDAELGLERVRSNVRFRLVSAGATHTCALSAESELYCWGTDLSGVLGDAPATSTCSYMPCALLPVRVAPTMTFDTLSVGYEHSCALRSEIAYCWGRNQEGQLGRELTDEDCGGVRCGRAALPVATALRFDALSVRGTHSCALRDGTAYCWGDNSYGQLAAPASMRASSTPLRIASPSPFRSLTTGGLYSCGLTREGTAACWGHTPTDSLSAPNSGAVELLSRGRKDPRFVAIGAGGTHTCALTANGAIYCWGRGLYDRLGGEAREMCEGLPCATRPVRVALDGKFTSLSVGGTSSCAVARKRVTCWGSTAGPGEPTLVARP